MVGFSISTGDFRFFAGFLGFHQQVRSRFPWLPTTVPRPLFTLELGGQGLHADAEKEEP